MQDAIHKELAGFQDVDLVDLKSTRSADGLEIEVTLRTRYTLHYEEVVALQESLVNRLDEPVSLRVNQVFADRLDPLVPPTPTQTPTSTFTYTPGPSPTASATPTFTATASQTATFTFTPIDTATPTSTATATATPAPGVIRWATQPAIGIYQYPGGPLIGLLYRGQGVTILNGQQVFAGHTWSEVQDAEGRIGWTLQVYLVTLTPAVSSTSP